LYTEFLKIADKKKEVEDADLEELAHQYQSATAVA